MLEITLNTSFVSGSLISYNKIAKIHDDIRISEENEIKIVIDIEKRIGLPLLFYISTLPFVAEKYNKTLYIHCNDKVISLFKKTGYINKEETNITISTDLSSVLMQSAQTIHDKNAIFSIVTDITAEAPVQMNEKLSELFISKVGEMFNNAHEHSEASYVIGIKYFKYKKVYCFSCYDNGVGIPSKVQSVIDDISDDVEALKWATKRGNSTASNPPRGLGLSLLQNFARANEGVIKICSGKTLYMYNKTKGEQYYSLEHDFEGTLFEMDIISDNEHEYVI